MKRSLTFPFTFPFTLLFLSLLLLTSPVYSQTGPGGGIFSTWSRIFLPSTFAALGTPSDGSVRYCSDCSATSPCTGAGTGAVAQRVAGTWNCSIGGGASAPLVLSGPTTSQTILSLKTTDDNTTNRLLQLRSSGNADLGGFGATGILALTNGTSAAPSHSFTNFPTFGLYAAAGTLGEAMGTGQILLTGTTAAPTALTGNAVAGAGVDAGTHSYKVTYVTSGGETDAGAVSNTVTTAGGSLQVNLSAIPLGNAFVTSRKIYRTTAGNAVTGPWLLQSTIANNTATTLSDNTADASLTTAIPSTNTAIDTRWTFTNAGTLVAAATGGSATVPQLNLNSGTPTGISAVLNVFHFIANSADLVSINSGGAGTCSVCIRSNGAFAFSNSSSDPSGGGTMNTLLTSPAAATLQLGAADAVSPVAQTIRSQGSRGGTDSNVASPAGGTTIQSPLGTGTAVGDQLNLSRGIMQASGTTAHTAAHAVTVCESKTLSNTTATTTTIATIGLASNSAGGLAATITVTATDGTNFDSETQDVKVSYVNKAGVITIGTPLISTSTAANNSGSATIGATVTGATPLISLKVTPAFTTIVPTTVTSYVTILNNGAGAVACQ